MLDRHRVLALNRQEDTHVYWTLSGELPTLAIPMPSLEFGLDSRNPMQAHSSKNHPAPRRAKALVSRGNAEPSSSKAVGMSWLRHLPDDALEAFSAELDAAILARDWQELDRLLISWRSTALIYSDPELAAKLAAPSVGHVKRAKRP